jgi:hypothetical protein
MDPVEDLTGIPAGHEDTDAPSKETLADARA